jgi:hypothetical protein
MPTRGKQVSVSVLTNAFAAAETKRGDCSETHAGARKPPWLHGERLPVRSVPQVEQRQDQGLPGTPEVGNPASASEGVRPGTRDTIRLLAPWLPMSDLCGRSQCPESGGIRAEQGVASAQAGALAEVREGSPALSLGAAGHPQEDAKDRGEQGVCDLVAQRSLQLLQRGRRSHRAHPVGPGWRVVESHRRLRFVQCHEAESFAGRVPLVHAEAIVRSRANSEARHVTALTYTPPSSPDARPSPRRTPPPKATAPSPGSSCRR